jgi:OmpA-OmpF porin, OOP family
MENKQSIWGGLRWPIKAIVIALPILLLLWAANKFNLIPGLKSTVSQQIGKIGGSNDAINADDGTVNKLAVPDVNDLELANVESRKEIRLMNWVWFGNAGIFAANGGLKTMKNTLMDQYKVNLKMITNNSVMDMKREQLAFITDYAKGNADTKTGVHFVTLMGDGAPAYLTAMNEQITKAYGKEYNLKIAGMVGFSMGEDCGMGPMKWKENPQNLKGAIISAVIGDGDWALIVRYAADNNIKVNGDPDTYDADAVNFVPAPDDDFMKAAEEVIAGRKVKLKEKDATGKLTGKVLDKKIEGCATWFPGDKQVVDNTDLVKFISTKQYPNQMATVVVGCDKWMKENKADVVNFFNAALTATNQIKTNDAWFKYACDLSPKVFCADPSNCSESADDWYKFAKSGGYDYTKNGNTISIGGTQMANLADNKKYFGIKGGNNYYKSVYEYFSSVLKDLNPAGFMSNVSGLTSYEDALDLSYIQSVNIDGGATTKVDYTENKGDVIAKRNYKIEFESGSDRITSASEAELKKLFDGLNIAERAKVSLVGHTDNAGDPAKNKDLSYRRAKAVKQWLIKKSNNTFPSERFTTDGKGQDVPVANNTTPEGKAQNRRVEITLSE